MSNAAATDLTADVPSALPSRGSRVTVSGTPGTVRCVTVGKRRTKAGTLFDVLVVVALDGESTSRVVSASEVQS